MSINHDDTVPLFSLEAEYAALGCVLFSPKAADALATLLAPEDFYSEAHEEIFRVCQSLSNSFKPIDYFTIRHELTQRGTLAQVGGEDYLMQIAGESGSSANVEVYAEIIQEYALQRRLFQAAKDIAILAKKPKEDLVTPRFETAIDILTKLPQSTVGLIQNFADIRPSRFKRGIKTSFLAIDALTSCGGFPSKQFTVIIAETGGGKTTFGLSCYVRMAKGINMPLENGARVMWVTFADLDGAELKAKIMKQLTGHSSKPAASSLEKEIAAQQWQEEFDNFGVNYDMHIVDAYKNRMRSLESILGGLKTAHAKRAYDCFFFDYAQRMRPAKRTGSAVADNEYCAELISEFAKVLGVPCLVFSQASVDEAGEKTTKNAKGWLEASGLALIVDLDEADQLCTVTVRKNRVCYRGSKKNPVKVVLTYDNKKTMSILERE